ncbi:MAG: hypothetical protein ACFCU6_10215 [Balneolaceae bacterium]
MLVQSPLKPKKIKPNKRNNGKNHKKKSGTFFSFKDTITDGYAPAFGKRIDNTPKTKAKLPVITPWKVILASFLIGACGILYLNHVFTTQQALREVQQLELEYNKAKRLYNEKRLTYDRMIGPKEIYKKARENGFVNAGPADQILIIDK